MSEVKTSSRVQTLEPEAARLVIHMQYNTASRVAEGGERVVLGFSNTAASNTATIIGYHNSNLLADILEDEQNSWTRCSLGMEIDNRRLPIHSCDIRNVRRRD